MLAQADKLIERARRGEKISSVERRHCVAYLKATQVMTQVAMADLFHVSERQIRDDWAKIREEKAAMIREDDIGLVIADIALNFERQMRDIERSKDKARKGTRAYLDHCKTMFQLELQRVEALQNLGYYPKNIGNLTVQKFEYRAVVGKDGSVNTRPVELQEAILDGECEPLPALLPAPQAS